MTFITGILALSGFMLLVLGLISVTLYILASLGLSYVLARLGFQYRFLAWIPVVNLFALALAVGDSDGSCRWFGVRMPSVLFAVIVTAVYYGAFGIDGWVKFMLVCLACGRMYQLVYSKIEGLPESDTALLGYLSGVIGIIPLVKFLIYRHNGLKGPWS